MPRLVGITGGDSSGKTIVIQHLTRELKKRGYRVGLVREVNTEWINEQHGDSWKFDESSPDMIAAAAINETAFFVRRGGLSEILTFLQRFDYVLLEGFERERTVAKIIAARDADEVMSLLDDLTIAISGLIAELGAEKEKVSTLKIPIINCKVESEKLADIVEKKALPRLPEMAHCGECGYKSCYEFAKAFIRGDKGLKGCPLLVRDDVILEVNGRRVPLKTFPSNIIRNIVMGIISSLKITEDIKEVKIIIKNEMG